MIEGHKVLAVTLARGGSKGIPKKNITPLYGKPLLQWTIEEVKKSQLIDKYIVSSDDSEILKIAESQAVWSHLRPAHLARDGATSAEALLDVVDKHDHPIVVEIMCTSPLKTVEDIDGTLNKLVDDKLESIVSVVKQTDCHPARIKYLVDGKLVPFYPEPRESRRQDLRPEAYMRNGAIYAMRRSYLVSKGARTGPDTGAYIMPEERSVNIDGPLDLLLAEALLKQRYEDTDSILST